MAYAVLGSAQKKLVQLEDLQRDRRQTELLERWKRAVDEADDRLQVLITLLWYWLAHQLGGPTEDDMVATLRLLRGERVGRRYRLLMERAQAELDAAEAGEPGPVFADLWQWLAVDREPGHGRAGTGLTW